jgi:hypothetical protein
MEPKGSFWFSQDPATAPYHEPIWQKTDFKFFLHI